MWCFSVWPLRFKTSKFSCAESNVNDLEVFVSFASRSVNEKFDVWRHVHSSHTAIFRGILKANCWLFFNVQVIYNMKYINGRKTSWIVLWICALLESFLPIFFKFWVADATANDQTYLVFLQKKNSARQIAVCVHSLKQAQVDTLKSPCQWLIS